jgi:GNAT superfamily N-acetyltransferase
VTDDEETIEVVDRMGRRYKLELFKTGRSWFFKLWDGDSRIGQMSCGVNGQILHLSDVNIYDKPRHRMLRWHEQILEKLGLRERRIDNYQRRGLGTALVNYVIDRARKSGFVEIKGEMVARDLQKNPNLPSWYKSLGFSIKGNTISMKLSL